MSMSKVANKRQTLMLFSTTWLEGSKGFSFSDTMMRRQQKIGNNGLWTPLNRIPLEINGRSHASSFTIAQLQMMNC